MLRLYTTTWEVGRSVAAVAEKLGTWLLWLFPVLVIATILLVRAYKRSATDDDDDEPEWSQRSPHRNSRPTVCARCGRVGEDLRQVQREGIAIEMCGDCLRSLIGPAPAARRESCAWCGRAAEHGNLREYSRVGTTMRVCPDCYPRLTKPAV
jgi:hypothetical protein